MCACASSYYHGCDIRKALKTLRLDQLGHPQTEDGVYRTVKQYDNSILLLTEDRWRNII